MTPDPKAEGNTPSSWTPDPPDHVRRAAPFLIRMYAVKMSRNPGDNGQPKQLKTVLAVGSEGSWRRRECVWSSLGLCVQQEASR